MAVGSNVVDVEEIGKAHLADGEFQTALRHLWGARTPAPAIAPPPRRLEIEDRIEVVLWIANYLRAQIQGSQQGSLVFATTEKAVRPFVGRVKRSMRLKDDVGLACDKDAT